jgi:hypothetical protein
MSTFLAAFNYQRALTLIVTCVMSLASGSASAGEGRFVLWGVENDSCAAFLQEKAQASPKYSSQINWIAGYVSAGNGEWTATMAKKGIKSDFLKDSDPVALEAWVVNYCSSHPLEYLGTAAVKLEQKLLERVSR